MLARGSSGESLPVSSRPRCWVGQRPLPTAFAYVLFRPDVASCYALLPPGQSHDSTRQGIPVARAPSTLATPVLAATHFISSTFPPLSQLVVRDLALTSLTAFPPPYCRIPSGLTTHAFPFASSSSYFTISLLAYTLRFVLLFHFFPPTHAFLLPNTTSSFLNLPSLTQLSSALLYRISHRRVAC